MKTSLLVEILAMLAMGAILPHNAEGQVLTKCGLKSLLEASSLTVEKGGPTVQELVAQIVCKVELTSSFRTSLITRPGPVKFDNSGKRQLRMMSPRSRGVWAARTHKEPQDCSGKGIDIGRLHGAFQLSNRVACNDGSTPSLNLCQSNCSSLLDDYIRDDVDCDNTIRTVNPRKDIPKGDSEAVKIVIIMQARMFPSECENVEPAEYFSEC